MIAATVCQQQRMGTMIRVRLEQRQKDAHLTIGELCNSIDAWILVIAIETHQ